MIEKGRIPIGFEALNGGANNQKLAMFGLFLLAKKERRSVVLPGMVDFVPGRRVQRVLAVNRFFDEHNIRSLLDTHGVRLVDRPQYEKRDATKCFKTGARYLRKIVFAGSVKANDFFVRFIRQLQPVKDIRDQIDFLKAKIHEKNIRLALQLRIEKDWQEYAISRLYARFGDKEDYNPGFRKIFTKLSNTPLLREEKRVLVCCDEENLPVSKEEIATHAKDLFGKEVFFKSSFLALRSIGDTRTAFSLIDFDICASLPFFVGLTRSTFSNLLCFKKLITGKKDWKHFIYNHPSESLLQRIDGGGTISPFDAVKTVAVYDDANS